MGGVSEDGKSMTKLLTERDESGYMLENYDPLFMDAAQLIFLTQIGSTSLIQRKFCIGYNRARRLMDQLEEAGIVGCANGSKPRKVLVKDEAGLNRILVSLKKKVNN